ncbi:MAG: 16S rRNA (guanine(966)-N(2))-methyltransferase RsmD [Acidobacteria bacterium]|nr:16S rRNA (guanine(966)-N(2))-methyltransferase RsmD [Acidobacteriota bacterium]
MRVIAGEFRSRRLKSLAGLQVRPTPDRLREALFSALTARIGGAVFLDAYAGTGAVGLEALSRGAGSVIFLEQHREAVRVIQENVRSLGVEARCRIVRGSVRLYLRGQKADMVFVDPPYSRPEEYDLALNILSENPAPLVIVQHDSKHVLADTYGTLRRTRILKHGGNSLSFYEPAV